MINCFFKDMGGEGIGGKGRTAVEGFLRKKRKGEEADEIPKG